MGMRLDFEKERKHFLNLAECDTKTIFTKIFDFYKQKIINSPRNIAGYTVDLIMCTMNGFNKLGKLEELNSVWGDNNFYVDLNNSSFFELIVDKDGDIKTGKQINFKDVNVLKDIENIPFSLKELIELCRSNDFQIVLFAKDYNEGTTAEIDPYRKFNMNESIEEYLKTVR